jgi:ElaB/YqjD/DUF883 family membrane-anchored ribosome-binding protein
LAEQPIDRGTEITERAIVGGQQAVDRGTEMTAEVANLWDEVKTQALARGSELLEQVLSRGNELRDQVLGRRDELRNQATAAAQRARGAVGEAPSDRWVKVACVAIGLVVVTVIVRRVRKS